MITTADLQALLPLIVLGAGAVLVLLGIAARRHHGATATATAAFLALAAAALPLAAEVAPRQVTPLVSIDDLTLYLQGLILAAAFACTVFFHGYLSQRDEPPEEAYVLVLVSTLGGLFLASADHFAALFLGLETLSVGLYGLIAYTRDDKPSLDAGIKYLVLAAAASAFLLFGGALLYAATGTLALPELVATLTATPGTVLSWAGLTLVLVGFGFKLALVPFHWWTADVYRGAPAPTTAFIATVSKAAVAAPLIRHLQPAAATDGPLYAPIAAVAIASMLGGNLLALRQDDPKRLLAWSSVAHLGYLLVAILSPTDLATPAATYYLTAYVLTALTAFGALSALATPDRPELRHTSDLNGLLWHRPSIAIPFLVALLSLAGLPLTAGFTGKLYLLSASLSGPQLALPLTLLLTSALGLFAYLRLLRPSVAPHAPSGARPSLVPIIILAAGLLVLVAVGAWPGAIILRSSTG